MTAASRLGNELLAFKNTLGTSLIIATRIITDICSGNRISHERILRTGYLIRREGMARRVTHFALIAARKMEIFFVMLTFSFAYNYFYSQLSCKITVVWSILRSISFRLGTGNGFTIDLKVKLVTVVLCWVYVIIQRKIMSSIFCPKQAVFSY